MIKNSGAVIWLTGLSGAGKTTIAQKLKELIADKRANVEILDGDVIRTSLSKGLGFSKKDRNINVERVGYVSNLLSRNGVIVIVAMVSPYRLARDELKLMTNNFIEVYVNAPLEICESRDVKGLYIAARKGEIEKFTGIDDPYEPPLNPDITCFTDQESLEESVFKIIESLKDKKILDNTGAI
jgi:adenylylsulfate kinase